ncbi:hypothetical protein BH09MYX1_BH09MYX1_27550 [soil metagenome]
MGNPASYRRAVKRCLACAAALRRIRSQEVASHAEGRSADAAFAATGEGEARRQAEVQDHASEANARTLDTDAILALDKPHEGQFIEAMYAYAGIREKTGLKTLETLLDKQAWQPSDFSIELWDVYEGGRAKPRFEFWVQNEGDGMLFEYGRATCLNSIGSTQHSFESHGADDPKTLALLQALQAVAEKFGAV